MAIRRNGIRRSGHKPQPTSPRGLKSSTRVLLRNTGNAAGVLPISGCENGGQYRSVLHHLVATFGIQTDGRPRSAVIRECPEAVRECPEEVGITRTTDLTV
jgi:hypothetical protein